MRGRRRKPRCFVFKYVPAIVLMINIPIYRYSRLLFFGVHFGGAAVLSSIAVRVPALHGLCQPTLRRAFRKTNVWVRNQLRFPKVDAIFWSLPIAMCWRGGAERNVGRWFASLRFFRFLCFFYFCIYYLVVPLHVSLVQAGRLRFALAVPLFFLFFQAGRLRFALVVPLFFL